MTVPAERWGVILVPLASRAEAEVIGHALEAGRSIFTIDLSEVTDRSSLLGLLGREFLFPYEARDFNVALSLLADLDWFANDDGYLIVLRNASTLEDAHPELVESIFGLMPNLCDRWHSGGTPFDVLVVAENKGRARMYPIVDGWNHSIRTTTFSNVPMYEVPLHEYDN